jgi:transmembrane sensor
MNKTDPPTDTELAAYFAGHVAGARAAEIEAWMANDPANTERAEVVRLLLAPPIQAAKWDRDRIWDNITHAIERDAATPQAERPAEPFRPAIVETPRRTARERFLAMHGQPRRVYAVAKIAAVVIAIAYGAHYYATSSITLGFRAQPALRPAHEYATVRGGHVTVQLSDGSRVTLAPESRLRVAAGFGTHDRSVELEGEGEFDVVHDSTRPFSVRAGRAIVVDIGTRFDLRAYAGDSSARVAVAEGAVTLGPYAPVAAPHGDARSEGVLIRKGEVGRLDGLGHAVTADIGTEATYFGWTAGHLVFEREPLRDVLRSIARWYDVEVTVPDTAVASRLVTAEFSTQSPSDMIHALAQAVNASVVGSGHTFTLTAR